jgi:hypothetical protein
MNKDQVKNTHASFAQRKTEEKFDFAGSYFWLDCPYLDYHHG